jgi:hypothetical protein
VERGGRSSVLHELAGEGWRRSDLAAPDLGVGHDNGWKGAGLARAGVEEGWRHSDLAATNLGVGCDNEWRHGEGWSAA